MSPTLFRPKASSRANRLVWTKNPQEGTMYMDNNTTFDQQSPVDDEVDHKGRQFQSSIKVVHGRPPYVHGRSSLFKLDRRIHSTWKSFNSP